MFVDIETYGVETSQIKLVAYRVNVDLQILNF